MNLWLYWTDPILRAPTLGCTLMSIAASLIGVVLLLQKRLLSAESISHAAYPGAILGILGMALLVGPALEEYTFCAVVIGALFSSWLGLKAAEHLERRWRLPTDAVLCLILSLFFGAGIFFSSWLQGIRPEWVHQAQILLFGQAATLLDVHIFVYGGLALVCALFIAASFHRLQAFLFDRAFSSSIGLSVHALDRILRWLLLLSVVIGIRSVGVVLMSGMLVAPAVAARQYSDRLRTIFPLAALFGALSGLLGNILSVEIALRCSIYLPTGPLILLVGAGVAFFSLLFAPRRGVLFRLGRLAAFRVRRLEENLLKGLWKHGTMELPALRRSYPHLSRWILFRLARQGWIVRQNRAVSLSPDGQAKANSIVRLHRLWELYLTEQLGLHAEKVHHNAEEMEHILTPEWADLLTKVLLDPKKDPHQQPIPEKRIL